MVNYLGQLWVKKKLLRSFVLSLQRRLFLLISSELSHVTYGTTGK